MHEYHRANIKLRFDENIINRIYLIMFFNSRIGKILVEKYSRQGLQTNLNLGEVGNLYIPILPKEIQQQIKSIIAESYVLQHRSKALLDAAKRAVEIAIEQDEAAAEAWLKSKTVCLG